MLNLLGEKYLEITPGRHRRDGARRHHPGRRAPTPATTSSRTLGELTTRTEDIDTAKLSEALTTLGDTLNAASPHIQSTFTGLSRISQAIASRDEAIEQLLARADRVTKLLAERRGDLVTLMKEGDLVFKELIARREAIHTLLVNANKLAVTPARHRHRQPEADQLGARRADTALQFLQARKKQLDATMKNLGPYASILINIIGTGPWFDAYVPNFVGLGQRRVRPGEEVTRMDNVLSRVSRQAAGHRGGRAAARRDLLRVPRRRETRARSAPTSTARSASTRAPSCA